jgi:ligand-binding SRPBCC domain-containing protein
VRIEGERCTQIDAPPGAVWQLVADITNMASWSPMILAGGWIPPATGPAIGARFSGTNRLPVVRRWTSTATVTSCEPGRSFGFAVGADPAQPASEWHYRFEASEGGTLLTERWRLVREHPVVLFYFRLIGQADRMANGVEETLRRLKAAAEIGPRA